ncbi:MAG: tetratricopeptide repeat protein [bacterium]
MRRRKRLGRQRLKFRGVAWSATANHFLLVFLIGLALRTIYIFQARAGDPLFFSPQLDGLYHHQWALAILNRVEFINDAYFRAPLYPFFLALLYWIFGLNLFAVRLVQAVLGGLSCGLVYLLGRRLFDQHLGIIAGLVMAVYPLFIYFDGELLIPVLLVFLLLVGFICLFYSAQKDRRWWLAGIFFGLAAIARPNILVFVFVLPVWFILKFKKGWWRRFGVFIIALFIPIVPVTVRNYLKSGQLVLIAWQAGTNFYIGNNEYSDGTTAIVPGTRGTWWGGYNDVKLAAERAMARSLLGAEIDRFWMAKGFDFWRRAPVKALFLTLKKVYLWFSGYEVSNDRDLYFFKRYTFLNLLSFSLPVFKFPFGLLFPLAVCGLYLTRKSYRRFLPVYLFLFAYSGSFIFFFVTARYRLPLIPFYIFFAIAGFREWLRAVKSEKVRAGVIFVLLFVFLNLNIAGAGRRADPAQNHFTAALGWQSQGRLNRAEMELQEALSCDSASNILSLGVTLSLEQGRMNEAEVLARAALRLHPDEPDAYGILGNFLAQKGDIDSARMMFEQVVKLDPYSAEGWHNLGNVYLTMHQPEPARQFYQRAVSLNPGWATALFSLGLAYYYEGKPDSARSIWQQVLKLAPDYTKARDALNQLQ